MSASLPTGTVTFLFTDIEGSTALAQAHPAEWESARQRHHAILQDAIGSHRGFVFQVVGDATCAAFTTASDGVKAALAAQRALQAETWGATVIRVRMGLHTGAAEIRDGEYHGYLALAHAQRVMSTAYGGQTLTSNAAAGLLSAHLPTDVTLRDMGEHRLKGILNPERLWQVVVADLTTDFPPLQTLNAIPNNLPLQVTSFIGRERELAEVRRLLTSTRLLTLTGSGGTGKTRLSLQLAAEVLDHFKDGVWFVELAPLADPSLVSQTAASVLGVREEQGRSILATLSEWLRPKKLLLILDNCEHLIEACAKLADAVLHAGPELRVLASSREALSIIGETTYRVPSLECPSPAQAGRETTERLTQYAAVQLFIDRASQSLTTFKPTQANVPAIAQICFRLDGIPLAIELAAARVRLFPPEQMAGRLDDRFRLLTGGSRTALPRQQTLRGAIDWSYSLLSEPERVLLRRLSVFAGGWYFEAAESVCCEEGIDVFEVLQLLSRLVEKSLVVEEDANGIARYHLLETIRQYARDKLLESNEALRVSDRHLQWFTHLAEETEPKLRRAGRAAALALLEDEVDDLRAAIAWAFERQSEAALRLMGALYDFWLYNPQGHISEGRALAERALASFGVLPNLGGTVVPLRALVEAKTLRTAGNLAFLQGDYLIAQTRFQAAEARALDASDRTILSDLLNLQGVVKLYQGYHAEARALCEQSVMVARQGGDEWVLAFALWFLGDTVAIDDAAVARRVYQESLSLFRKVGDHFYACFPSTSLAHLATEDGEYAKARTLLDECLAIRRKQPDKYIINIALNSLAEVLCYQRDYDRAATLSEEALSLSRALSNKSGIAWSLRNLAAVASGQGDGRRAEELLRESLGLYRELDQKRDIVRVLESLAAIALDQESPERAATLWGAASALRETLNVPRSRIQQDAYERSSATARAQLGAAAFDADLAAGRALTLEQAIALALDHQDYARL